MILEKLDGYYLVKIFKERLEDFDIFDRKCIEKLFQEVLKRLLKKYNLSGLLEVDVYVDVLYGMIIEIRECYSYFEEIDLEIQIHLDCVFLREVLIDNMDTDFKDMYYYGGKYYKVYDNICDSPIIYREDEVLRVMNSGVRL